MLDGWCSKWSVFSLFQLTFLHRFLEELTYFWAYAEDTAPCGFVNRGAGCLRASSRQRLFIVREVCGLLKSGVMRMKCRTVER
jgi:hypothetical protein